MIHNTPTWAERIISALSYLTAGWVGVIYYVYLYFAKKHSTNFLRFNVLQAIFIALLYFVLAMSLKLVCSILLHIPFIQLFVSEIQFLLNRSLIFGRSIIQLFILFLMIYLTCHCLMGKYPRIYKISKIIDMSCK